MILGENKRNKILLILNFGFIMGNTLLLHAAESLWLFPSNGNVAQSIPIDISLGQCLCPQSQWGTYFLWCRAWQLVGNYGTISFTALATNDIHVGITVVNPWSPQSTDGFYAQLVNSTNLYEIVIGGWSNGMSVIRRGSQGQAFASVEGGIPIDPKTGRAVGVPVQYKVIVYKDHKNRNRDTIAVFYLNPLNPDNKKWTELISYQDPFFISGKNRWFSLSCWDNPIFYTSISASSSTALPPH